MLRKKKFMEKASRKKIRLAFSCYFIKYFYCLLFPSTVDIYAKPSIAAMFLLAFFVLSIRLFMNFLKNYIT